MAELNVARNASLDVVKLAAAYMVVFIHFKFTGVAGDVVDALARFAVPVFLMISGYFAYGNSLEKLGLKLKNIFRIYASGAVLYCCFYIFLTICDAGVKAAAWYCISYVNPVILGKFILLNVPRSSDHLWFLTSLLYVYCVQWCLTKHRAKEGWYLWGGVGLMFVHLVLGVGLSSVGIVVPIPFLRNFLLMGYPMFCVGMLIRKYEEFIHKLISCKSAILLILAGVLETCISYCISGLNELYFGSVWVAAALLVIALKVKDRPLNGKLVKLSQMSTAIYLIHVLVGICLERIIPTDSFLMRNIFPVLVCIASTIAAQVIAYAKRSKITRRSAS